MVIEQPVSTNSFPSTADDRVDVVVVGAGFAGIYALHRLRAEGFRVMAIESGGGVGGTWFWNRYPGARCDVESIEYSYSFSDAIQQEWDWTERYAGQPEIERYINFVVDRLDLRDLIHFNTKLCAAVFDDRSDEWHLQLAPEATLTAPFLVMATGSLSAANVPDIAGRETFRGDQFHTGRWPHEHIDFSGKRVGIIGTGSSSVQALPVIAEAAEHVTVFQRTPTYTVPARNGPLAAETMSEIKQQYPDFRRRQRLMPGAQGLTVKAPRVPAMSLTPSQCDEFLETGWKEGGWSFTSTFNDTLVNPKANDIVSGFARRKIRETVIDPEIAALLEPTHPIICKRLCLDSGYHETYNRPNVELADLRREPFRRITPSGVELGDRTVDLDALIFATGFDAMTGSLLRIDMRGSGGVRLCRRMVRRSDHVSRPGCPRIPESLYRDGAGEPFGAVQHDHRGRTTGGLDHAVPGLHGGQRS